MPLRLSPALLLATLLIACSHISQDQAAGTSKTGLADNSKSSTFAFDLRGGMIFVPVRINGSKPLAFVLDTGSEVMVIDGKVAKRLGLKAEGKSSVRGAGAGLTPSKFIHDVSISLPGIESTGYEFSTVNLHSLKSSFGIKIDGVLGWEFFDRFVVTVDYESKQLTVISPEAFHLNHSAQALPIEFRGELAFVKAELMLPGPVTVQDSFMIDSGSGDAVDHPSIMKLKSRVVIGRQTIGLGAPVTCATAQATSLRLGSYTLSSPTVNSCAMSNAAIRLIGNETLQRFTVTFDYPSSRIFITPNSSFEKPFPLIRN